MRKMSYIENLESKIEQLESYFSKLKNSNEYYTKFEQVSREKLDLIMKDHRWLLALAIDAVTESMKQDKFKEMIINDTIADEINQQKLLDLCEVLFDKILKQLLDVSLQINSKQISN